MKKQLIGHLQPEQIAELKKEHGSLISISTESKIAYFRKPLYEDLNIATMQADPNMPLEFTRDVMKECFLGGSSDVINNDQDYMGASKVFSKLMDGTRCELVEL